LPHAAAKATEAAAPEATEAATTATAASTRCMAGTPTYGYACGKLAQRVPEGEPMLDVRRREVITLLGSAAAWPLAAHAQQPAMPVIGFLRSTSPADSTNFVTAFRQGLKEAGFVEGQNVVNEYRWAEGQNERLAALVADLIRRKVAVIVGAGVAMLAAKAATTTVPIVFASGGDPVQDGLVASLNRPGGNVTGVVFTSSELGAKRLELLRQLVPKATTIAVLVNPHLPNSERERSEVQAAAQVIGQQLLILDVSSDPEIKTALSTDCRTGRRTHRAERSILGDLAGRGDHTTRLFPCYLRRRPYRAGP
jgi:hypothetical protein